MGTAEILIVFSALMALIALVTIGIDWIGKPLKHRRFIPRMYRFDDEKLPVDEYGNTTFDAVDYDYSEPVLIPAPYPPQAAPLQPPVHVPGAAPHVPHSVPQVANADHAHPTVAVPTQAPPRKVAQLDPALAAAASASRSAFTDSLAGPEPERHEAIAPGTDLFAHSTIAGTSTVDAPATSSKRSWSPGMALDATVNDQKPSLAIKAERFWIATADLSTDSHFDHDDLERMASGKAPRRANPRTGRVEAMQLTGLRKASEQADVRMRWPDDAVDPWSTS